MTATRLSDLQVQRIEEGIRARGLRIGLPLILLPEAESTNDTAAFEASRGAPHGLLVVADRQTAGRGRLGRTWVSPGGQNLYLSIILRPQLDPQRLAPITLAIGLGVVEALSRLLPDANVQMKWPNDVLITGRKVAGILVETATMEGCVVSAIAGIGINVNQTSFDHAIDATATSMALHAGGPVDRTVALLAVLECFEGRTDQFLGGGLAPMLEAISSHDATLGRRVRTRMGEGIADGIEQDGSLRVRTDAETRVRVQAGEVDFVGTPST